MQDKPAGLTVAKSLFFVKQKPPAAAGGEDSTIWSRCVSWMFYWKPVDVSNIEFYHDTSSTIEWWILRKMWITIRLDRGSIKDRFFYDNCSIVWSLKLDHNKPIYQLHFGTQIEYHSRYSLYPHHHLMYINETILESDYDLAFILNGTFYLIWQT